MTELNGSILVASEFKPKSDIELLHDMILELKTRIYELEQWTRADEDAIYARIKQFEDKLHKD